MKARPATYSTGEPRDNSLFAVGLGYLVLITLFIISFVTEGYGGPLVGMILLVTRLLLLLAIPGAVVAAILLWRGGYRGNAMLALLAIPLALLALLLLAPL